MRPHLCQTPPHARTWQPHATRPPRLTPLAITRTPQRKAQELPASQPQQQPSEEPPAPAPQRFRSGLGGINASLRTGTLEQLLLQGLVASAMPGAESDGLGLGPQLGLGALGSLGLTAGEGRQGGGGNGGGGGVSALQGVRSNTIENILRETLSGGKELEDLMMDWGQGAAQQEVRGRGIRGWAGDVGGWWLLWCGLRAAGTWE